jgi:hypothetical protein
MLEYAEVGSGEYGVSDESVLSSQRGNASIEDSLRTMAHCVIAVWLGHLNVNLGCRPLDTVAVWAARGKERESGEVSVAGAGKSGWGHLGGRVVPISEP